MPTLEEAAAPGTLELTIVIEAMATLFAMMGLIRPPACVSRNQKTPNLDLMQVLAMIKTQTIN